MVFLFQPDLAGRVKIMQNAKLQDAEESDWFAGPKDFHARFQELHFGRINP